MLFDRFRKLKKSTPEMEENFRKELEENGGLEKNDLKAMIIAGFITFMPLAIVLFLLIALFCWFFVSCG